MSNKKIIVCICVMLLSCFIMLNVLPNIETVQLQKGVEYPYETTGLDKTKVTQVNIEVDEKDWEKHIRDPFDRTYYAADITIGDTTIKNVGFRSKGYGSILPVLEQAPETGRYSIQVDFDYYDEKQTFQQMKSLNLNNMSVDPSSMREYLSLDLMEEMGIPTPAHSYMQVSINGEVLGLYIAIEEVDQTFINSNFNYTGGALYKPGISGLQLTDNLESDLAYMNPKKNYEGNSQEAAIAFLDVINNGGDLYSVMDVDEMIRFFASTVAIVSLDSYNVPGSHNFYLYEDKGIFSIIPWDFDHSFGLYYQLLAEDWLGDKSVGAVNFSIDTPAVGYLEDYPLLTCWLYNDEYKALYHSYLEQIATGYLSEKNITQKINNLMQVILPYIKEDPTSLHTVQEFFDSIYGEDGLIDFSVKRSKSIINQLNGFYPSENPYVLERHEQEEEQEVQQEEIELEEIVQEELVQEELIEAFNPDIDAPDEERATTEELSMEAEQVVIAPNEIDRDYTRLHVTEEASQITSYRKAFFSSYTWVCVVTMIIAIYFVFAFKRRGYIK